MQEAVCDVESKVSPSVILQVLDDTIEYCVAAQGKDKAFPDNIESIILSRLYTCANLKSS